uniref:Transposase (Putative), gypsy type n=1 Tax=Tanacetum cinerariifolium TaxID=118510 RepID=A0A6L2KYA3_TANCI|nr:hypothetical protein [Tanacetum cinerariifolium]
MSTIIDIRCALTQKALDTFYELFHIPDEVHHVLPTPNDTMHERPARKIRLYTRDPFPTTANFNAEDYATIVAHPSPFWKFTKPVLRLVGLSRHYTLDEDTYPWFVDRNREDMDLFAFIHILDPTKVRVVERERAKGEPRVLETTVGRTILLLPVAPNHANSELEAKDMAVGEPRRLQKKRKAATEAGGSSHPPKKLKSDYRAPNLVADAGKSPSDLGDLLARSVLIVESSVEVVATLLFVTSSVSATPECDIGVPTAPARFLISSDSSHHSSNAFEAECDSIIRVAVVPPMLTEAITTTQVASVPSTAVLEPGTKVVTHVHAFMFQDSYSIRTMRPDVADYEELFIEFSVGTTRQACLSSKVRMQTEFCLSERGMFESELEKQTDLLKTKDKEVEDLKVQLFLKEAEAAEAIRLLAKASNFKAMERSLRDELSILNEHNAILEKKQNALDGKETDLEASVTGKEREITTMNAQLTAIKSQNNNFVDQLKTVNDKFEKLYADFVKWLCIWKKNSILVSLLLFLAVDGSLPMAWNSLWLAVGITHCAEGMTLADVAGYNSSVEAKYVSALQHLQSVDFSFLSELRLNKDASIDTLMNILRLEDTLPERLGLIGSQPHVDQLMFPIHHTPNKVVIVATSMSFALDVCNARVQKIKENIMSEGSAPWSGGCGWNVNPFPNVDDVMANTP